MAKYGFIHLSSGDLLREEVKVNLDFVVSSRSNNYELKVCIIHCDVRPHKVRPLYKVFSVASLVQDWHLEYQSRLLVVVDKVGGSMAATFYVLTKSSYIYYLKIAIQNSLKYLIIFKKYMH